MGADVIKVEHPDGGDSCAAGRRSIDGLQRELRLAEPQQALGRARPEGPGRPASARAAGLDGDVVIENNRPGVMERLGPRLRRRLKRDSPKLVYCSISAYGQSGPRAQEGGFDLTMQAMSGIMSVTGEPGGAAGEVRRSRSPISRPASTPPSRSSRPCGRCAAAGDGEHIDVSMLGATLGIAALQTSEYFGTGTRPAAARLRASAQRALSGVPHAATAISRMAAGNDKLWKAACDGHRARGPCSTTRASPRTALRAKNQDGAARHPGSRVRREPTPRSARAFAPPACPARRSTPIRRCWPTRRSSTWAGCRTWRCRAARSTRTFGRRAFLHGTASRLGIYRRPPALGEHNDEVFSEIEERTSAGRGDMMQAPSRLLRVARREHGVLSVTLATAGEDERARRRTGRRLARRCSRTPRVDGARLLVSRGARAGTSAPASTSARSTERATATCCCASCASSSFCRQSRQAPFAHGLRSRTGGTSGPAWTCSSPARRALRRRESPSACRACSSASCSARRPPRRDRRRARRGRSLVEARQFDAAGALELGLVERVAAEDEWLRIAWGRSPRPAAGLSTPAIRALCERMRPGDGDDGPLAPGALGRRAGTEGSHPRLCCGRSERHDRGG